MITRAKTTTPPPPHYEDSTEDVDEAADPVRIRLAGGSSVQDECESSSADEEEVAAEISAKSRFFATVARTGFVRFFSFMKSANGKRNRELAQMIRIRITTK